MPSWLQFGLRGTPTAADVAKVVETGIVPRVNTGIAHRKAGVAQTGADLVRLPMQVLKEASVTLADRYGYLRCGATKLIELAIPLGISALPRPTYEPLQVKYFKRLAPDGANGLLSV